MKDTTELPEGTEPAKQPKSRTPARPKTESATPASQEPSARPTRRRTSPPANPITTSVTSTQNGAEITASTTTNSVTPPQNGAEITTPPAPVKAPVERPATTPMQRATGGPVQSRPTNAPGQRSEGGSTQQRSNYTQGQRFEGGPVQPRPTNAPGQRSNYTQGQRLEGGQSQTRPNYVSGQRTESGPAQQRPVQQRFNGPAQQRQGNPTVQQRPGGPNSFPQRTGNNPTPQGQRQGNFPSRAANQGGTTYAPSTQRSGGSRPGGYTPGGARPTNGGHGRSGGGRPGTTTQRPQERRVAAVKEKATGPIALPPQIMVKDLADLLKATPNEVIKVLISNKIFANINQVIEYEKAATVAKELGFEPSPSETATTTGTQGSTLSANEAMMAARDDDGTLVIPPVVTIMGHVDHGKTSLLDTIRKTKVAAGEAGGITQHIGAYQVEVNGKKITFLDTPGHEAFTAMRARGAQVTHIVIIVVAADDGVMPQTREAISHAQAAKVPIIIALNKIDKANANPDHVKQQLAEMGVVIEEYGGDIILVPVSARRGTGIDELLDYILLVAEVQDIKANPNRLATGVIIEARLEKNSGPTATVLVQQGTLKMGDNIIVGSLAGKVRAMFNDRGKRIQKAPPSTPVSIIGLPEVPQAGDQLEVTADEKTAKQRAQLEAEKRKNASTPLGQVSLDTLYTQMQEGKVKELNIVLKCDVQGSAEALKNALSKLSEENIKVRLIHEGIGNISETDVHLAAASDAVVIGFNVKADGAAQRQAQKEGVDIRYYNVIYKLTDEIQAALTGMLEPTYREVVEGHAEVVQTFKAGKTTVIAGCRVTDGKLTRSSQARVMRKGEKVHEGKIDSIRRGKDDVREVTTGYECGIVLEDFTTFEAGDIIEAFAQERVKPGA
ncbi:MAG: translation initiation factor IF-2 [Ktedonobacteraceae bacterium]